MAIPVGVNQEHLRFILGLKLKTLRQESGRSLKNLAGEAGISISYLSEIEKGKKYPKPDKLLDLANALGVTYNDLVSVSVSESLNPLTETLQSPLFSEFPFEVFGLQAQDLFSLFSEDPSRAGALVRTFLDIGQMYDMRVEHFLFAALRSYQLINDNYFADIEDAAAGFRDQIGSADVARSPEATLQKALQRIYGYEVDLDRLAETPELRDLRSVFSEGPPRKLYVNKQMMPIQRAFVYGRELGYDVMGLGERATTSSWLKVTSFEQVLNNFKASYFAGAVLIDRDKLVPALREFFASSKWSSEAFLALLARFSATPEMFVYRLGQLLPHFFGFQELYFHRLSHDLRSGETGMSKVFNRSSASLPQSVWLEEQFCRRWAGMRLLEGVSLNDTGPVVRAQRSRFVGEASDFFEISVARPLQLSSVTWSCVTLGFRVDDVFRSQVAFADDPDIERRVVNMTCERCPLGADDCADRAAEGSSLAAKLRVERRESAIADLVG